MLTMFTKNYQETKYFYLTLLRKKLDIKPDVMVMAKESKNLLIKNTRQTGIGRVYLPFVWLSHQKYYHRHFLKN